MVGRTDDKILFGPLQISMDDGPQSGSEGSELHSPGFGSYPPNDNYRYHHQQHQRHQHTAQPSQRHPQFEYLPAGAQQQPPLIDSSLEIPNLHHAPTRLANEQRPAHHYLATPVSPRLSADYRYQAPPSHDTAYTRSSMSNLPLHEGTTQRPAAAALESSSPTSPTTSTTQPPQQQPTRREGSTAVIACRQCRSRKIRCDSTRPVCNNCVRRSNVCEYDAVPKRRGPDKKPGTRQRSCKKRPADEPTPPSPPPKRRRSDSTRKDHPSPSVKVEYDDRRFPVAGPGVYPQHPPSSHYYPTKMLVDHPKFPRAATLNSAQRDWWDQFLQTYSLAHIRDELSFLFRTAPQYLSFINIDFILDKLGSEPFNVQPSFVLAGMAMAQLMNSGGLPPSAAGETVNDGIKRAVYLRNLAQNALDAAYDSQWIDGTLAEAALILTLFETSLHPEYSLSRIEKALVVLDNIIRQLALTDLDASDPDVTTFSQRSVPIVQSTSAPPGSCNCPVADPARAPDPYSSSTYELPWDGSWNEYEIRQEECRRLCWSALGLAAQYSIQCAVEERSMTQLFICDPKNYAILFPAEVVDRRALSYRAANAPSPKDSVWALYSRSMLLWCFCDRLRRNVYSTSSRDSGGYNDRAEDAQEAWNEAQAIQDALDSHQCNLDTGVMWMTTEYIYNSRMAITQTLRSLTGIPSTRRAEFTPKQAMEWIRFQEEIVKRATMAMRQYGPANYISRRPYQAPWFATQLELCLRLFESDRTLYAALQLGQQIAFLLSSINQLWPCPEHQRHCDDLRERLQTLHYAPSTSTERRSVKY
ncbi:hypothetical protein CYLTODRAFT_392634 [Cylindrobasidium torrendii FP15055 ss-10]|uniref:Zn(2)-C6 fungal-type domain-containing protein n=1 Tax=Cylindrobasidium torrendii FP15055 ss-10 TaxID=1314674 RepID=A0A0D7BK94_9AGAR|nr:hypothetical protein CYLTODRAFT_392634 [Cylindrobasidium torrendii FP15055 ss-10]